MNMMYTVFFLMPSIDVVLAWVMVAVLAAMALYYLCVVAPRARRAAYEERERLRHFIKAGK